MNCGRTHFWPRLIFWCHFLQTFVGANMRPDLHMLPNAACPARWVPDPETRGIRATARPVLISKLAHPFPHIYLPSICHFPEAIKLGLPFPHPLSSIKAKLCTNQYPKTQQRFGDPPSRSQHMVDACSWPFQCEQSGQYQVEWEN